MSMARGNFPIGFPADKQVARVTLAAAKLLIPFHFQILILSLAVPS